ncbi:MAG: response regulator [Campylobacterales bacterium]|nr:response regulator [Campylobacterales bacterium]
MSQPLVVFIDDSETALTSTKIATQDMPIEVKQYLTAQEALDQIVTEAIKPGLIITDLNMPEMNGLEFLSALRQEDVGKKIPVLMLTTETKDELKQQGKALGLTGWIVKPFNPSQLQMAIKRVLRIK